MAAYIFKERGNEHHKVTWGEESRILRLSTDLSTQILVRISLHPHSRVQPYSPQEFIPTQDTHYLKGNLNSLINAMRAINTGLYGSIYEGHLTKKFREYVCEKEIYKLRPK